MANSTKNMLKQLSNTNTQPLDVFQRQETSLGCKSQVVQREKLIYDGQRMMHGINDDVIKELFQMFDVLQLLYITTLHDLKKPSTDVCFAQEIATPEEKRKYFVEDWPKISLVLIGRFQLDI